MPSTVEQLSPSRVKLTIEVPFADLKPSLDRAYREVAQQVTIPGFRKGKVPPAVIDQRVGRGTILQEAINAALPQFYGEAVAEHQLNPLAQPEVQVTELVDREKVEFTAEVDVRPEFDLPDVAAISVEVPAVTVDDDAVTEQLDALRTRFGSTNDVDRAAAAGDVVTIDLVASKDGEALSDATAEGVQYEIGSGGMLDGLDEAVTGLSAGEKASFATQLVGGELRGQDVEVEVSVGSVAERDLPEADDDFAQLASEFDTIDELREQIRGRLLGTARLEQAQTARDAVLEEAIAGLGVEVPEGIRTSELEARKQQITAQLAQAQMSLEDYLEQTEEAESPEAFWADVEKRSSDALIAQMLLDAFGEDRDIQVDQNDLTQYILNLAQRQQTSPDEVAKHMVEHDHIAEYMTEIRRGKALAAIVEAATVTDSNGETVNLADLQPDGSFAEPQPEGEPVEGTVLDADADADAAGDTPADQDSAKA